jgi:hypothetical protein
MIVFRVIFSRFAFTFFGYGDSSLEPPATCAGGWRRGFLLQEFSDECLLDVLGRFAGSSGSPSTPSIPPATRALVSTEYAGYWR